MHARMATAVSANQGRSELQLHAIIYVSACRRPCSFARRSSRQQPVVVHLQVQSPPHLLRCYSETAHGESASCSRS